MANGALQYDVTFSGLDKLSNLKLPDLKPGLPDLGSLTSALKLPGFSLPPIPAGFGLAVAGVFTAAAAAGIAAFGVGIQTLLGELQQGVKLQVDLSKSLGAAAIKAGESQPVFKQNVTPTINNLLSNESIATPLKDITETVKSLAGQGLDSKGIATILPTIQQFSGSTGGEVDLNTASDLLFSQLQKLNLKATVENVSDIAALNSAAANTGKLTPADTQTFLKYALSEGDGSRKGNLKSQADLLKVANLLTNAGLDASAAGTGLRAFQTSLLDTKKLAKSGFDVKMNNSDGSATGVTDRLQQVLKQFVATRESKGLDAANRQAVALVGDTGLPVIQALASVKNTAELEAKFSEMNSSFDGKVSSAATNMARVAAESAQSLSGSIAAYENAREGLQLKLGSGAENLVASLARGGASIVNTIAKSDNLFSGMKTQFDALGAAIGKLETPAFIGTMATILAQAVTYAAEFVTTLLGTPLWNQLVSVTNSVFTLFQSLGTVLVGIVELTKAIAHGMAAMGLGTTLAIIIQIASVIANVVGIVIQIGAALMGSRSGSQLVLSDFSSVVVALEKFNAWLVQITPKLVAMSNSVRTVMLPAIQAIAGVFSFVSQLASGITVSIFTVIAAALTGVKSISSGLTALWDYLTGQFVVLAGKIEAIQEVIAAGIERLVQNLMAAVGAIVTTLSGIGKAISTVIEAMKLQIMSVVQLVLVGINSVIAKVLGMVAVVNQVASAIRASLMAAFSAVQGVVAGIVTSIAGLMSRVQAVIGAFSAFKTSVANFKLPDFKPQITNNQTQSRQPNLNVVVSSSVAETSAVARWGS